MPAKPGRKILRIGALAVVGLLLVALIAGSAFAYYLIRQPLPAYQGERVVGGLDSTAEVIRDERGIPQIYAETAADLFFVQGYVHAQERFFEMDYRRHVTSGRLAELVGDNPDAIAADMAIRTMGWRNVAEEEFQLLSAETQSYLTAYAEGVNTYLNNRDPGAIAVEYTVLGTRVSVSDPEPWTPIDSLAWLKAMAWDLRGNYNAEMSRTALFQALDDIATVNELFPPYDEVNYPPIVTLGTSFAEISEAVVESGSAATQQVDPAGDDVTGAVLPQLDPATTDAQPHAVAPQVDSAVVVAMEAASRVLAAVPNLIGEGEGVGSGSWVVSGALTQTGAPILANDSHMAVSAPGVWMQMGLHCRVVSSACPFDVAGFTFAGFPGVIIGHNAELAWGLTNLGADVTDFYLERIWGDQYWQDGQRLPVTVREETIEVADAEPITFDVRSTHHGPIISDQAPMQSVQTAPAPLTGGFAKYDVALSWTALTPGTTADALLALNVATSAADIAAAAAQLDAPAQSIIWASTDGHIGYQASGRIPVRAYVDAESPADGTWPQPGWDSRYDWQGFVPADQMPTVVDPAEGFIVAANQPVTLSGAGPFFTADPDYGFRAARIRALIQQAISSGTPLTVELMNTWQNDNYNPAAELLMPYIRGMVLDRWDGEGLMLLRDWDYANDADSPAAAYFNTFLSYVYESTFSDELPSGGVPDDSSRWLAVLAAILPDEDSRWWDDKTTPNVVENRDQILSQALVSARYRLTVDIAKNTEDWQWGRIHTVELTHPLFVGTDSSSPLAALFNPRRLPVSGGSCSLNATNWNPQTGPEVVSGPTMRMVVDLANLDDSTWVVLTGVSGHPGSRHYTDQIAAWADGRTYQWPFSLAAVQDDAKNTLTFKPTR